MNYGGRHPYPGASWNYGGGGGYGMMGGGCPESGPNYYYPPHPQYYMPINNPGPVRQPFWASSPGAMRGGVRYPYKDRGGTNKVNNSKTSKQIGPQPPPTAQQQPSEPSDQSLQGKEGVEEQQSAAANDNEQKEAECSVADMLKGRNPIMYCNEQSKLRRLVMKWEQVGESGPPHDKTFTWTLSMGDLATTKGSANSKKGAKNAAAEEMAKKLYQLPKPMKRFHNNQDHQDQSSYNNMMMVMNNQQNQPQSVVPNNYGGALKKRKVQSHIFQQQENPPKDQGKEQNNKALNPAQDNPISKLYEHCKQNKLPDPLFEVSNERILESVRTVKGFLIKKTEFTIKCDVSGQSFVGVGMTKKQAKFNAAAAAWAQVGGGAGDDGGLLLQHQSQPPSSAIDNLLQSQRTIAESTEKTADEKTAAEK